MKKILVIDDELAIRDLLELVLKRENYVVRTTEKYLYEGENEDKDLQKIYFHLINESDRLTSLINELLMLSRFDKADREVLTTEKTDLSILVDNVVLNMKPKADKREITLEVNLEKAVFLPINKILISHAIANILDNAIKYSNTKSHIRVETFIRQMEAVIKISDQGIGIEQSDIAKVQERFYRAKNANAAKGSGLGLSICKEIVEKFNGHLVIESELGMGTTVSMILPLT